MAQNIARDACIRKERAATEGTEATENGIFVVFLCALCDLCGRAFAVFLLARP